MAAPFITVSGNVTDPRGIPYAGGTIVPILNVGGSPTLPGVGGSPYVPPIGPFALDSAGNFSFQLAANNQILPANSTWSFTISSGTGTVPIAFGKQSVSFTVPNLTLNADTDITAQITALVLALTYAAGGGGGGGTVTSVASANIPNIGMNVTIANPTTTPTFSFAKQNTTARSIFGNSAASLASAAVSFFTLTATSDVEFDSTVNSNTTAGLIVQGLHFGATQTPLSSTPPTAGQVLGFDGTNIVGLGGIPRVIANGQATVSGMLVPPNGAASVVELTGTGIAANDSVICTWSNPTAADASLGLQGAFSGGVLLIDALNPTLNPITIATGLINWMVLRSS